MDTSSRPSSKPFPKVKPSATATKPRLHFGPAISVRSASLRVPEKQTSQPVVEKRRRSSFAILVSSVSYVSAAVYRPLARHSAALQKLLVTVPASINNVAELRQMRAVINELSQDMSTSNRAAIAAEAEQEQAREQQPRRVVRKAVPSSVLPGVRVDITVESRPSSPAESFDSTIFVTTPNAELRRLSVDNPVGAPRHSEEEKRRNRREGMILEAPPKRRPRSWLRLNKPFASQSILPKDNALGITEEVSIEESSSFVEPCPVETWRSMLRAPSEVRTPDEIIEAHSAALRQRLIDTYGEMGLESESTDSESSASSRSSSIDFGSFDDFDDFQPRSSTTTLKRPSMQTSPSSHASPHFADSKLAGAGASSPWNTPPPLVHSISSSSSVASASGPFTPKTIPSSPRLAKVPSLWDFSLTRASAVSGYRPYKGETPVSPRTIPPSFNESDFVAYGDVVEQHRQMVRRHRAASSVSTAASFVTTLTSGDDCGMPTTEESCAEVDNRLSMDLANTLRIYACNHSAQAPAS